MRRRLVSFFDRKGCSHPDELADETLNRVARRLEEEGDIRDTPPARYCYIVARFVFLEYLRRPRPTEANFDIMPSTGYSSARPEKVFAEEEERERLLHCLDTCLSKLDQRDRELILDYYQGEQSAKAERRRDIARRLGLSINAVSIRACRIRSRIELCMRNCPAKA